MRTFGKTPVVHDAEQRCKMFPRRRLHIAPQRASHVQMYAATTSEILRGGVCYNNNTAEGSVCKETTPHAICGCGSGTWGVLSSIMG